MEDLCGSGANRYVRTRVAGLGTVARDGDIREVLRDFTTREIDSTGPIPRVGETERSKPWNSSRSTARFTGR